MNNINFTHNGGMPFTQEVLEFMQITSAGPFEALATLAGPLVIISGVTVAGSVNTNGWVAINGELMPFEGGTITGTVGIIETVNQLTYLDGDAKDVYIYRKAANVVSGAYNWADFVRLPRLFEMTPAGIMQPWAGAIASIPLGWLLCNGQAVSRTTYAALFAAIGITYGAGNGTTSFNLPDMQGRTAVGVDPLDGNIDAVGDVYGAKTHTLDLTEIPNHNHSVTLFKNDSTGGSQLNTAYLQNDSGAISNNLNTSSVGGNSAHNNMQPSMALPYLIKY